MVQQLILIGGGEHGRVVVEAVRSHPEVFDVLGFVDPESCDQMVQGLGLQRLGDDQALRRYPGALGVLGVGALGPGPERGNLVRRVEALLAGWAAVVHRAAWVSPTARIGPGAVVMAGAVVNSAAKIGAHCVVNTGAIIEHDVVLGDFAFVGPGAVLGGAVQVGAGAYIGLGAAVRDHRTIGANAMIGMGAVVVTDVPTGATVLGVPARPWGKRP